MQLLQGADSKHEADPCSLCLEVRDPVATTVLETQRALLQEGKKELPQSPYPRGDQLLLKAGWDLRAALGPAGQAHSRPRPFPGISSPPLSLQIPPASSHLSPCRTHQARTAHCWTPLRSRAPVHPDTAAGIHPGPVPCTGWRPGNPQSGPGCRDHLGGRDTT